MKPIQRPPRLFPQSDRGQGQLAPHPAEQLSHHPEELWTSLLSPVPAQPQGRQGTNTCLLWPHPTKTFPPGRERAHSRLTCLFLKAQSTCSPCQHWSTSEQLLWHLPHSPAPPLAANPWGSVTCASTAAQTQRALSSNGERVCEAGHVTQATTAPRGLGGHNCHCYV